MEMTGEGEAWNITMEENSGAGDDRRGRGLECNHGGEQESRR